MKLFLLALCLLNLYAISLLGSIYDFLISPTLLVSVSSPSSSSSSSYSSSSYSSSSSSMISLFLFPVTAAESSLSKTSSPLLSPPIVSSYLRILLISSRALSSLTLSLSFSWTTFDIFLVLAADTLTLSSSSLSLSSSSSCTYSSRMRSISSHLRSLFYMKNSFRSSLSFISASCSSYSWNSSRSFTLASKPNYSYNRSFACISSIYFCYSLIRLVSRLTSSMHLDMIEFSKAFENPFV